MPTATQTAQLVASIQSGDRQGAQAILEAMVREQRERGYNRGAEELERIRLSLQRMPGRSPSLSARPSFTLPGMSSHPYDNDEHEPEEENLDAIPENLQGLLIPDDSQKNLDQIYLSNPVKEAVDVFLDEFNNQEKLIEAGLGSRNRIIMAGPPGNGKTVLASAISKKLGMEMFKADFSQIISAYMGIGPRNLGNIFRFLKERPTPACLFMDEADAIITSREMLSGQAAGACAQEYRVMVNTILTGMDELGSKGLLVAATNFERNLDSAAIRRFNLKLWLKPPAMDGIKRYIEDYQTAKEVNFKMETTSITRLVGQPWSKIEEFCQEQHRSIILGKPCHVEMGWVDR